MARPWSASSAGHHLADAGLLARASWPTRRTVALSTGSRPRCFDGATASRCSARGLIGAPWVDTCPRSLVRPRPTPGRLERIGRRARARLGPMRPYEGLLTAMVTPFRPTASVDEEARRRARPPPARERLARPRRLRHHRGGGDDDRRRARRRSCALIVARARRRGRDRRRHGLQRHPPRRAPHRGAWSRPAPTRCCRSRRTTTSRTAAGSCATSRRSRARPAARPCALQHPSPHAHQHGARPARRARPDRRHRGGQAGQRRRARARSTASPMLAGNDDVLAAVLDMGGAGGICVASHVVGPEMRAHVRRARRSAPRSTPALRDIYEAMFVTASPAPVKAALDLLGHDFGGVRLPIVEVDDAERAVVRDALAAHGLLRAGVTPRERRAARPPAGRRGRDRQEPHGRRVRGPDRRRRLRPALPDGGDDGHRPRAARLHVPARARRRHRGHRHHPRPRGPPRRAAVGPARARPGRDPGRLQRPADRRHGALQARRAQAARRQLEVLPIGDWPRPGRSASSACT